MTIEADETYIGGRLPTAHMARSRRSTPSHLWLNGTAGCGVALTMGSPDVAAALDRGVVDGAFTASSGGGIPWHDLLKYRYRFPTSWVNSTYIVNKDAMKALPEATQTILRDAASKWAAWASEEMGRQEDKLTKQFGQRGMVLTDTNPE